MSIKFSRPEGLLRIYTSVHDEEGKSVGLIDTYDKESEILSLRGIIAGPGISVGLTDADQKPGTDEQAVLLSINTATLGLQLSDLSNVKISAAESGQVLAFDGTDWVPVTVSGGNNGGASTGQNIGTSGIGLYKDTLGTTLRFKNIVAANASVVLNEDIANGVVSIGIDPSKIYTSELLNDAGFVKNSEISNVARTGSYADLVDKPELSLAATSGSYADLTNKPVLSTVATSGAYADLTGKPTLFSGSYADLANKPSLSTVATSGSYNDLTNKPTLFSGSYDDLTNKPTLSASGGNVTGSINLSTGTFTLTGPVSGGSTTFVSLSDAPSTYAGANNRFVKVNASGTGLVFGTASATEITGLATVATSGSYADLLNKPTIPTAMSQLTNDTGYLTSVPVSSVAGKTGAVTLALGDLTNVNLTGVTDGSVLKYSAATSSWIVGTDNASGGGSGTITSITAGTGLSGGTITTSGTISLANTTVTAGSYGTSTTIPSFTVDAQGRLTNVNNLSINFPVASVAGKTGAVSLGIADISDINTTGAVTGSVLKYNATSGKWEVSTDLTGGGSGTVTSVGLSLPNMFTVTNSPVTTTGTLTATLASQTANTIFAAPSGTAGAPSFRALTAFDIPSLDASKISTGTLGVARGGTGATTFTTNGVLIGNGTSAVSSTAAPTASGQYLMWNGSSFTWGTPTVTAVTSITAGAGLTGGTITSTGTIALATTGVTSGSYTNANITVDQYGRITAVANGTGGGGGSGTVTGITAGTGLSGGTITTSGTIALANTTVTAGSYGSATSVPTYTVDAQGRLTAASNTAITFPVTSVNGKTGALSLSASDLSLASVATSGSYNDLTNKPTIPTALSGLTDVNTSGAVTGSILKYNSTSGKWEVGTDNTSAGSALAVQDEGTTAVSSATTMNFTGAGVSVSNVGGVATVNIPGGGGSGTTFYRFRVNYATTAFDTTNPITELPAGWSASVSGTVITITHNMGKRPATVYAHGWQNASSEWQMMGLSATFYMRYQDASMANQFKLTITSTSAIGTASGGYAYIELTF